MLRVLRTAKATLVRTFYLDEVATPASGSVVVSVSRLDGTVVDAATAVDNGDGSYAYTFPGRDVVDLLTVTWTLTVGGDAVVLSDEIEVVGGFYFSLGEGRAVDAALASTTKFPTTDLIARRIETEDECERICGQAFVPRFARETLSGSGQGALMLRWPWIRAVRSVVVGSTAYSPQQLAGVGFSDAGMLYLESGWPVAVPRGTRNITVEYEHGRDRPPSDIVRGAKTRFKSLLLSSKTSTVSDRAERVVSADANGGTVVYGSAVGDKTGLPEADAAYSRYPSPRPGFG